MGKGAAGSVASATIYTGGRIATNGLSWASAAIVGGLFIAGAKALNDDMIGTYNKQTRLEITMVETALKNYIEEMENFIITKFQAAYPDKPQVAEYQPILPGTELSRSFQNRMNSLAAAEEYQIAYNHLHRVNYLAQKELCSPGFQRALAMCSKQAIALMEGQLPVDDLRELTVDVAENAALRGMIGNTQAITMRRLGVSTLRAQAAGRAALKDTVDLINATIPADEIGVKDLVISPSEEVNIALQQAQLIQQSLQQKYNVAARKAPYLMGELAARLQMAITRLQFEANKANMGQKFVPDYRGVFSQLTGGLMNKVSETFAAAFDDSKDHPAGPEQAKPDPTFATVG